MNPLYQQYGMGQAQPMTAPQPQSFSPPVFQNPMQRMNYIMQAMTNPARFVKERFNDIPDQISGDPNQILDYLRRTRGITDEQMQQTINQMPQMPQMFPYMNMRRW